MTRGVAYAHVAAVSNNKHGKEAAAHAKRTTREVKRRSALEELIAAGSDPELRGKLDALGAAPSADMLMVFKIPQLKALIAAKACVPKGVGKQELALQLEKILNKGPAPLLLTNV